METSKTALLPLFLAAQVGLAQADPAQFITNIKDANPTSAAFNREAYLGDVRSVIDAANLTIPQKRGSRSAAQAEQEHCKQVAEIPSQKIVDDLKTLIQTTPDAMPLLKLQVDTMRLNLLCGHQLKF